LLRQFDTADSLGDRRFACGVGEGGLAGHLSETLLLGLLRDGVGRTIQWRIPRLGIVPTGNAAGGGSPGLGNAK